MSRLSDAHHTRKMIAGCCMVASPLLLLIGSVLHPDVKSDEAAQLRVVADNLDQWLVAHLFILVSIALAVPAFLGLMYMLREREVAYGHVGGGLAVLGLMALVGIVTLELVTWQMAATGNQAANAALLDRIDNTAAIVIPFFVVAFAFMLGMTVLAVGLYRARAVQSWMAAFLVVASVLLVLEFALTSVVAGIIGAAFLFVGLGSIGRMVLGESDEAWEHTPEISGFRPLPGMR